MKKFLASFFVALSIIFGFAACDNKTDKTAAKAPVELNIAAAANTAVVFDELKAAFEKTQKGVIVKPVFASSGKLVSQIKESAPFDLFLSADMHYAQTLKDAELATSEVKVYAKGNVALLSVRGIDLSKGLDALLDPSVKTIVIADPAKAPYGKASVELLKSAGIYDAVKGKIVFAGNIGEALSQTLTAGDVGFINASALKNAKFADLKKGEKYLEFSSGFEPILQGMIVLKNSKNQAEAKAFFDFILSETGKNIFKKYGYDVE